ncbi:hypothetical protein MACK_002366 [Theileria orientalis]|uniref:Uncharacterized protein n=1 Tax=Theileria orientalis TaxID=68886 RepID=A0A976QT31_THEOR|nr:hypothetical protein MACK_002366 [Theileria orientalis]
MAQAAKQLDIHTNVESRSYKSVGGGAGLTVEVTKEEHWDPLSKIFKKVTHTIQYPTEGDGSQYNIIVVPKSSRITTDTFKYFNPSKRVDIVEVFFKGTDNVKNVEPLVVRFVYNEYVDYGSTSGDSNKYYKWSNLKGQISNSTISRESFSKNDLVARLLEELGPSLNRQNKIVIRLDEQPDGDGRGDHKYPGSGKNKYKITVTKAVSSYQVEGYDGFEHTVGDRVNASEFYVSYGNDSRYFKIGSGVGVTSGQASLYKVSGYFETDGSRAGKLVLFTFTFKQATGLGFGDAKLYGYSYYDFFNELKKVKSASEATGSDAVKMITSSDVIEGGIQKKLQEEKAKLTPLISFETGNGVNDTNGNKNVTTSEEQEFGNDTAGKGYKFKKVEMTPKISDVVPKGGDGSVVPGGPWTVFSTKLFIDGSGITIDKGATITGTVLGAITTSGINSKVKGDNQWATDSISPVDNAKLTDIAKEAGIIVVSSPSPAVLSPGPDTQEGMSDGTKAGIGTVEAAGIATGVTVLIGAGSGFAIYKNFAAVSAVVTGTVGSISGVNAIVEVNDIKRVNASKKSEYLIYIKSVTIEGSE